jgi:hypothetical protein
MPALYRIQRSISRNESMKAKATRLIYTILADTPVAALEASGSEARELGLKANK